MITHAYPRWDGDVAGAFIERFATAVAERGHTVSVIAPSDAGKAGDERRGAVSVHRVRYASPSQETLAYRGTMERATGSMGGALAFSRLVLAMARRASRVARARGPAVLHAHWWVPSGLSARLARVAPYVITLHGTDVRILERSTAARTLGKPVLRGAAAVTAVSTYLAGRAALAAGLDLGRITIQPMPADTAGLTRRSAGGGGIVTVGRLTEQKRIELILEAAATLARRGRSVPLTVIGDGPKRETLTRRAEELGIAAAVRFIGEVRPERLAEAMDDADVFAFAARHEGLGLAPAEALMLGIPVVATEDGGGVTDVVPTSGGGRLVAPDPNAMVQAIEDVLASPDAKASAADVGEVLRGRLAPEAAARTFESIYAESLRRS